MIGWLITFILAAACATFLVFTVTGEEEDEYFDWMDGEFFPDRTDKEKEVENGNDRDAM